MTMKRKGIVLLIAAVLWCIPLALGLEVYTRVHGNTVERAAQARGRQDAAQNAALDETVWKDYATERPVIGQDMADRNAFVSMDDEARKAFAVSHRQTVALCERDGTVSSLYEAPQPQPLHELTARLKPGAPLAAVFLNDAVETADSAEALGQAFQAGVHVPREYEFTMPDGKPYHAQFMFLPVKDSAGNVRQVAVFIRDSMWKSLWLEFQPNVDQNDFYVFHSNNVGFRGRDIAVPKPPGVFRIVCIGGSTTAEGETDEMTYPAILEKKLRRHFKTEAIEVVNGGVYGINSVGEVQRMPDYLALQPDLILHYNVVNDLRDRLVNWVVPQPTGFMHPLNSIQALLRKSRFVYDHFNGWLMPSDASLSARIENDIVANLRVVVDAAQKAGVTVAVGSFASPDVPHLSKQDLRLFNAFINTMSWGRLLDIESYRRVIGLYNERVRALCKEKGAVYVPIAEEMRGGSVYFSDICHTYPAGRERKAAIIFDTLEDYVAERLPGQR